MDFLTPYMNYIITAAIALAIFIVGLLIYKALERAGDGPEGPKARHQRIP